jgi:hypothetical protein
VLLRLEGILPHQSRAERRQQARIHAGTDPDEPLVGVDLHDRSPTPLERPVPPRVPGGLQRAHLLDRLEVNKPDLRHSQSRPIAHV